MYIMKKNVYLISTLRQPFRSFLLLTLFGLITFSFMTKAVEFILVQRETEVLGNYYRSIGVLENIEDPQSGDISAGIDLIETSPYFAYGDQREVVSGVMAQSYNRNFGLCNYDKFKEIYPEEVWPNLCMTEIWFSGDLIKKAALKKDPDDEKVDGYFLEFHIDTLLAAYPEYATQGRTISLLFLNEGHESSIPLINEMAIGQRYFIRGWENIEDIEFNDKWGIEYYTFFVIKPLDGEQLWYLPLEEGADIDFNDPALAPFKNEIDVLNENLHTLGIITTVDMSAIPYMQEASRYYYLTAGRWLNHQDHLDGNKIIVVPEDFAKRRGFQLEDELQLTFRPLQDTYIGLIRYGVDALNWRSYPTYQDTFRIVGLYAWTHASPYYAYIPTNSLERGFSSPIPGPLKWENDYSFVLDSARNENAFVQAYKDPLQELGISLTILENNGAAYWSSVDPIRHSLSADLLIFSLLTFVALILAAFLYLRQRRRDYAILRALGVSTRQANAQLSLPLLMLGEIGILMGGYIAWNYALDQARKTLSTLTTPAGVTPSADLRLFYLAGLCTAVFLLLALFTWLGVFFLSRTPVLALLQGNAAPLKVRRNRTKTRVLTQALPAISARRARQVDKDGSAPSESVVDTADHAVRRNYNPASLSRYVHRHVLRSRLKSFLTVVIALGFVLAAGWIQQTMERSRLEVDRLYDTTIVEADILQDQSSSVLLETGEEGFVYLKTIQDILDSGFVMDSDLAAKTQWIKIELSDSQDVVKGPFSVYAYDSPEVFSSGLSHPDSLTFAPGWDLEQFLNPRTLEEIRQGAIPAIFPTSYIEQLALNLGEKVEITGGSYSYSCAIVGQYSGWLSSNIDYSTPMKISGGGHILIPLSVLVSLEENHAKFTYAHFSLDPKKNRELPQFRADMEAIMDVYGGGLRLIIWDEELRIVIDQFKKNISLLEALYPVVIVVSVLVGAGLCFLLLLQTAREAAILRVLGTPRTAVRLALISEPLILSIFGVVISLGIAYFLLTTAGLVPAGSLLTSAGLYLAGILAGSVTGAIMVTNQKPLALLQVKE